MPNTEYRVSFRGDIGNLQQFISSVGGGLGRGIRQMYQQQAVAPARAATAGISPDLAGARNITTSIDAYNRTITQTGQVFHRFVTGWVADINRLNTAANKLNTVGSIGGPVSLKTAGSIMGRAVTKASLIPQYDEFFTGDYTAKPMNYDRMIAAQRNLKPYFAARDRSDMIRQLYLLKSQTRQQAYTDIGGERIDDVTRQINAVVSERDRALKKLLKQRDKIADSMRYNINPVTGAAVRVNPLSTIKPNELKTIFDRLSGTAGFAYPNEVRMLEGAETDRALRTAITKELYAVRGGLATQAQITTTINSSESKIEALLAERVALENETNSLVEAEAVKQARINSRMDAVNVGLNKKYARPLNELEAAKVAAPEVPTDLAYFLRNSKSVRSDFIRSMGIQSPMFVDEKRGIFSEQFKREIMNKEITASAMRDFERGVTRLGGSVKDVNGLTGDWSYTIDKNMNKVETWGRSMRGPRNMLGQIGRDFQKVIEWTIATTAVFGVLAAVLGSFGKINEINADLQRFQITAKTTGEETKRAFQNIAQIAISTATPLREMTAVMDDIALATRRVNQTTEEWLAAQSKLGQAVGILTNLTGLDTAKATDMLTSAYKQLGQGPEDLIPLLSKLTAVSGGNAQSITDISAAIGGLAEAASAAGFKLDEMIGSVQVLSQVTNKSAAEVATSFKNLFGAINSPASEKMLKNFGIEIRDAAGNLRPFLEIYKEIYAARQSGVIPEGRYQDVLRAISGGPRRAPDAAALLSNLPKILEQIELSATATNEALMANAKILDTNVAKMEQMRAAFDAALVEKFTDAVNKLTELLITIGKVFTDAFGSMPSQLGTTVIQMGILLTALTLLSKGFRFLKSELIAVGDGLGYVGRGMSYMTAGATIAPFVARGVTQPLANHKMYGYGNGPDLSYIDTNRYIPLTPYNSLPADQARAMRINGRAVVPQVSRYTPAQSGYVAHRQFSMDTRPATPLAVRNAAGRLYDPSTGRYVGGPTTGSVNPIMPKTMKLEYANIGQIEFSGGATSTLRNFAGNAALSFLGGGKGKILGAGLAGIAGGAVAGAATGNSTLIQSAGLIAPFLIGGGAGLAVGVGLMAVGTVMQMLDAESAKAAETLSRTRTEIYDLTQNFLAQTKEYQNAVSAQKELEKALKVYENRTNLSAEETARLSGLQADYATTTLRVADATLALNDQQNKLLQALPKLGEQYKGLLDLISTGALDEKKAQQISTTLAEDILKEKGLYGAPSISMQEFFKQLPSGSIYKAQTIDKNYRLDLFGPFKSAFVDLSKNPAGEKTNQILSDLKNGNWRALTDALVQQQPFQVTQDLLDYAKLAFSKASPEDQKTEEFKQAVADFGVFVAQYGDQASRMSAAVSTYQAKVEAQAATGGLRGVELKQAQDRASLADKLITLRPTIAKSPITNTANARIGDFFGNNLAAVESVDSIIQKLVATTGAKGITKADAMEAFTLFAGSVGQLEKLQKQGVLENAAVDWYNSMGIEVVGLTDKVKGLKQTEDELNEALEKQQQLRESLRSAYEGTSMSLGQDLLNLQAAMQGGEYKDNMDIYNLQVEQIKALIAANKTLYNDLKNESEPALQALGDELGKVTGLYGLQYQSVEQLIGSVLNWGKVLGLTPSQIKTAIIAIMKLNEALLILQKLRNVRINIVVGIRTVRAGGGTWSEDDPRNPSNKAYRDALAAERKQQQEIDRLLNQLSNLGGSGNPGRYEFPQSTSGGGGGGGSSIDVGSIDLPDEWKTINYKSMVQQAVAWAKKYQAAIPGETAKNRTDLVSVMLGNTRVLLQRGIGEEYLRKAIDKLTEQIKKQNDLLAKADTISRIRIGAGDFAAIANVPMNSKTGISIGGPGQPININLNVNGQVMTPAQLQQLANAIAAQIKKSYQNS